MRWLPPHPWSLVAPGFDLSVAPFLFPKPPLRPLPWRGVSCGVAEGSRVGSTWAGESWRSQQICREGLEGAEALPKTLGPQHGSQGCRGSRFAPRSPAVGCPLTTPCPVWDAPAEPHSHRGPYFFLPVPLPGGDPPAGYPGLSQRWAIRRGRLSSSAHSRLRSGLSAMAGVENGRAELLSPPRTLGGMVPPRADGP